VDLYFFLLTILSMELIALMLDTVGTLLIAYAALNVHHRFRHEHKIDEEVFQAMRQEWSIGIFGIILIILAFVLEFILFI